jgi:hypothetical protein
LPRKKRHNPLKFQKVVCRLTLPVISGDDGARTRNHRIDNPVKVLKNTEENHVSGQTRTISAPNDTDLDTLTQAWPALPEALKAGILAMVKAVTKR